MLLEKSSKLYKDTLNHCWKCEKHEVTLPCMVDLSKSEKNIGHTVYTWNDAENFKN